MLVRTIHRRWNNFKRADLRVNCFSEFSFYTIDYFDFAFNGLEFIHPNLFSCIPNVKIIDLSDNHLYKMVEENITQFGSIFVMLKELKTTILANNKFHRLPAEIFDSNVNLENVDLSSNSLEQVMINLINLRKLKRLDLRNNKIKILDMDSLNRLNAIPRPEATGKHLLISLKSNPISCYQCKAKRFIRWLLKTNMVNLTSEGGLTCVTESRRQENINEATHKMVSHICFRETLILVTGISSASVTL